MRSDRENAAFFGTVTASVTHELRNVFSIIDQVAGLLEDLEGVMASGRPASPERMRAVQERIARQVLRGTEVIERLNRFAHTADDPARPFDAGEEIENLVALSRRFAELRKVRLESDIPTGGTPVAGDAFSIQRLVFHGLRAMLEAATEQETVGIELRSAGRWLTVSITGPSREGAGPREDQVRDLDRLAASMGGKAVVGSTADGETVLELTVPAG